jgi:hypothetical protein
MDNGTELTCAAKGDARYRRFGPRQTSDVGVIATDAELVAEMYDAHKVGRIDVEDGAGEIRRGTTKLRKVFASLLRRP